ncbi:DUF6907 domain-containing protein [Streptomyces erythrochromogenes]|uniref:DUF6907 domain-containing protein n=1 Tax=Streptomyces erythrochromogenes TaxID=285574 RepID=UPI003863D34D|nr:hypothetical protein OG364_17450 [Streptomyces erythrochromogenes]
MKTATTATNIASALAAATAPTGRVLPLLADLPAGTPAAARGPLTAAERGGDWIALYDCTPWCTLDHAGADGQPGWHQGPITKVTAPVPGVNADGDEAPDSLFEARVTQTREDAAVFGIDSKIWLDYGRDNLELDVAGADRFIAAMEAFLPQLRALRNQLALVARDDFPADEEAKAAYMAAMDARIKAADAAKAGQ